MSDREQRYAAARRQEAGIKALNAIAAALNRLAAAVEKANGGDDGEP